ncbi:MAG: uroporphyrinogen decarboxylase family protein, partial [Anaerolineae bacterium]|nr:uroporphyrinogen decarboxylase family protein [Anaerolineae bacterium]
MSSRQRMLAALDRQEPDHVPCSFMLFGALKSACGDYAGFVERQLAMGLDAFVELPPRPPVVVNDHYNLHGLPVSYDPRVTIREWKERLPDEEWPILVKEYETPAGTLRAEVRQTDDWRWGDHVPFLDDYIVPRSRRFLVTGPADLEALRYLLVPPTGEEIAAFRAWSAPAIAQARRHDLLLAGGWGVGADLVGWVHGLQEMVYASFDRPAFLAELLDIIAGWNRRRMAVVLDAGVDLYIKRAWYENLDFWSPSSWRRFLYPILKADVELAHERGARFGYLITSNCMPLLDLFAELGVDVLIGVDPAQWDMAAAKSKMRGRVCLWGGVNGHLTVEHGSEDEVRAEVREAMRVLAPGGGFILSPVDNVREDTPRSRDNVRALIDEWRRLTG